MRAMLLTLTLCTLAVRPLYAQAAWTGAFELGKATYSSAATDSGSDPAHLRPWHPTLFTLRVAREGAGLGLGVAVSFASGQEGVNVDDFVVLPGSSLRLLEFAPELRGPLLVTRRDATLRWHAGPIIDFWWPSGVDPRRRIGGVAGLTLALPMTEAWRITLRGDLALTSSYLTPAEASGSLHRDHTMRRARLAIGIARHL